MNTTEYNNKVNRLLDDQNTYEKLNSLPSVKTIQKDFNKQLKDICKTIPENNIREILLKNVSDKNPSLPYFYGIPKAHKPGCPLRPIVSTRNAPQSKLAKWLAESLSEYLGRFSPSHLLHSYDFTDRLRKLRNHKGKMISLDVNALFTNVALDFVLDKLVEKEREGIFKPRVPINILTDLIRLCVSSTVFQFNGVGYRQKFGVAMGSPLSPILANFCMEFLESDFISRCPVNIKPHFWVRYVDDIFILYHGNDDYFTRFLEYVNGLLPSITFSVEFEENNKLPFLDVMVHRDPLNFSFSFSVYRKPTNAEMYIHYFSYHSPQIKSNVVSNMVTRALRICDPKFLDEEFKHIRSSFKQLCYPQYFIDKAFSRAKRSFYHPPVEKKSFEEKNIISLPYHHSLVKVKELLGSNRKNNVHLAFSYSNSIKSKLVRNKDSVIRKDVGVYAIPCNDCNSRYIGETGRGLEVRLEEHKRACRLGSNYSSVAQHTLDLGHSINWKGSKVLHRDHDVGRRRVVEGALINVLDTFENNKSFTQDDFILDFLVINTLKINLSSFSTTPTAQVFSPSVAQALEGDSWILNDGADAALDDGDNGLQSRRPVRRSARLREMNTFNNPIT